MIEPIVFGLLLTGCLVAGWLAPQATQRFLRHVNRPLVRLLIRRLDRDIARLETLR